MTELSISGVGVWNIIQELGERIKQYEKEKTEAYEADKLEAGTKETPTIYQEADGVMIYTQLLFSNLSLRAGRKRNYFICL